MWKGWQIRFIKTCAGLQTEYHHKHNLNHTKAHIYTTEQLTTWFATNSCLSHDLLLQKMILDWPKPWSLVSIVVGNAAPYSRYLPSTTPGYLAAAQAGITWPTGQLFTLLHGATSLSHHTAQLFSTNTFSANAFSLNVLSTFTATYSQSIVNTNNFFTYFYQRIQLSRKWHRIY